MFIVQTQACVALPHEVNAQAAVISQKSVQLVDTTSEFINAAMDLAQSARVLKAALTQMRSTGYSAVTNKQGETYPVGPLINALKACKDDQKSAADKVRSVYNEAMHFANFHADIMEGKRMSSFPLGDKIKWGEKQFISIQKRLGKFVDSPNYTNAQRTAASIVNINRICDHPLPDPLEPHARALRELV